MRLVPRLSLLPRDRTFFDLFIQAGQNTLHAARLLDEMMNSWPDDEGHGREILIAEQEGDRLTHQLVQRLNSEASRCLSPKRPTASVNVNRFNAASSRPDRSLNLGERLRKKRSSRKMLHGGSPFRQPSSPKGGG